MDKFLSKYKQTGNKVSCRKGMIWLCSNLKDMQSNTVACVCIHIKNICIHFISYVVVQFSVMSYSVRPHGLQHARLPCPYVSCVCVYLCAYMHVHVCMHVYAYLYKFIYKHTYICIKSHLGMINTSCGGKCKFVIVVALREGESRGIWKECFSQSGWWQHGCWL